MADLFTAIAEPHRRDILDALLDGEMAVGALVAGLKLARSRSGEMRIVCDRQRSVRKVLEVTGLERVLDRYDSVDAATTAA